MTADDTFIVTPVPWALMLDYERVDVVLQLCRQFSFFSSDKLTLAEREEVVSTVGMKGECLQYLIIYGSVGNARKDAFLKLLRLARLTLVQDMASQVVVSPHVGDVLPNAMLYPLWDSKQARCFRKWNSIYWAMRCGLLRKIKRRRELMQSHVEQILSMKPEDEVVCPGNENKEIKFFHEETFYNAFRNLLDVEQEERNAPLELYHDACSEERVNISYVVANVPTLFIAWASWDETSMRWLREHIFNVTKAAQLKNCIPLTVSALNTLDDHPWLQTVMKFVHVPRRIVVRKKGRIARIPKRAQIVLINLDREKNSAIHALDSLVSNIPGWKSPEVSLLPLWCGPDGLQSNFATDLNISTLPYFVATQLPDPQKRRFGDCKGPRICFITPQIDSEPSLDISISNNNLHEMFGSNVKPVDWHLINKEERKRVMDSISSFIASSDVPLRFNARVDRTYQLSQVSSGSSPKHLKYQMSSFVSMSGTISTTDLLKLKDEIRFLSQVKNLDFNIKVMRPSNPLVIKLNPVTPSRYVYQSTRSITCSECLRDILIENEAYFRCLHCEQLDGVLCLSCFANDKHPQHHILLRVAAGLSTTLELLWGPSNVAPLSRFCGSLVTNVNDKHIGVYCNVCSKLVQGIRWKCSMCYQYDMCGQCYKKINRSENIDSGKDSSPVHTPKGVFTTLIPSKTHPADHLFLCIRHGCGADDDEILKPVKDEDALRNLFTE
ncbi:putative beta prime cop protein [Trypanosoma theileri]|uniref:Putative beta prime cop protein n=1 Tax=Trypanosoma theileri TaxID=67003 RepID=A0A1X0NY20_9TRYP|nr:putative beta prime cop protein [Trypanosoma theileri]ORC89060.1 putative beta prime cop protein [Trypanosoma theileri]